jgi:hypothetical protein
MTKQTAIFIAAACLAGCNQLQYAGTEYVFAPNNASAVGYIELGCMYRTADATGCAGALKRAGNPDDDIPDPVINSGTWWLEQDNDGGEIKIRWNTGETAYIPAGQFGHRPARTSATPISCLLDTNC